MRRIVLALTALLALDLPASATTVLGLDLPGVGGPGPPSGCEGRVDVGDEAS